MLAVQTDSDSHLQWTLWWQQMTTSMEPITVTVMVIE